MLRTPEELKQIALDNEVACKVRKVGDTSIHGAKCWSTYTKLDSELSPTCDKEGCSNSAVRRIAINCHGVIYEVDVCETHFKPHGAWVDSL